MRRVSLLLHEIAITEINKKKYNENKKNIKNKEIIIIIIIILIIIIIIIHNSFRLCAVVISSCSTPLPTG